MAKNSNWSACKSVKNIKKNFLSLKTAFYPTFFNFYLMLSNFEFKDLYSG